MQTYTVYVIKMSAVKISIIITYKYIQLYIIVYNFRMIGCMKRQMDAWKSEALKSVC